MATTPAAKPRRAAAPSGPKSRPRAKPKAASTPKGPINPIIRPIWHQYAHDVVSGKILANKRVIQACQRHLKDLKRKDIWFDEAEAQRVCQFAEMMPIIDGPFYLKNPDFTYKLDRYGQRIVQTHIILLPWMAFFLTSLIAWKKKGSNLRRFRTGFAFIPRKNAKSTLAGIPLLYLGIMTGKMGAQCYTVGTKYEQAKVVYEVAQKMVERTELDELLKYSRAQGKECIVDLSSQSKIKPLVSDFKTLDGANPYVLIFDEIHAYESKNLYYVLDEATGAQEEALTLNITTAGVFNPNGICQEQYDYACAVLDGIHEDDSFFALMYEADEGDAWDDRTVWFKANPSLGMNKNVEDMERQYKQCVRSPEKQSTFLTKQLNIWVNSFDKFINLEDWKACGKLDDRPYADIEQSLLGRKCYGGLDMASTEDLASLVLMFPPEDATKENADPLWRVLIRCWCPDNMVAKRAKGNGRRMAPYDVWVRNGFLHATPGDVIDADYVLAEIRRLAKLYDVREIAYDSRICRNEAIRLQNDGLTMYEFYQGPKNYNEPMVKLNDLLRKREFSHGSHPGLTWQANNVVAVTNADGLFKPDKAKAADKIDAMVALYMGFQRALMNQTPEVDSSILWF